MSHTYQDLLAPGRQGDTTVIVKMTARQVAIGQLLLDAAVDYGIGALVIDTVDQVLGEDVAERSRLEFDIAQKRIGIAMCRVLGEPDRAAQLTAELALLDGEVAGL